MRHMKLEEWDRTVAPLLGTISLRANSVCADIQQIKEWVDQLPVAPAFPTMAQDKIDRMLRELEAIVSMLREIKTMYESKETVD